MLLSGESKVLCKIILAGMKDSFEDRLHNELAGCCNKRSWCDEFATLWTILRADLGMEQRAICLVFVAFETVPDSVDWEVLWKIVWLQIQDPWKNCDDQVFYNTFKARDLQGGDTTEPFSRNSGVCTVCLLSTLLFLILLDWVSHQATGDNETGIQLTLLQKLEDLDFADDLLLLSQKVAHMQQNFQLLREQAARVRPKVNATNSKEMRIWPTSDNGNISCAGEILKQKTAFTYWGRCWGQVQKGTSCSLHCKTNMEIWKSKLITL